MSFSSSRLAFDRFVLDRSENVLYQDGQPLAITPKALQLLCILIENRGHIVEKERLIKEIWCDSFVEDGNLTFTLSRLRKAIGDHRESPVFIETVPRRGYRFIADVKVLPEELPGNLDTSRTIPSLNLLGTRLRAFTAIACLALILAVAGSWGVWRSKASFQVPLLSNPYSLEPLSTNGQVRLTALSSDGRILVYTNGVGKLEGVWLRQLDTGNNVEIIPPSECQYFGLALTPGNDFLYFVRRSLVQNEKAGIFRISIFGGVLKKIADDTEGWIRHSPDGQKIAFVRCIWNSEESCSLLTANAADGTGEEKIVTRSSPARIADLAFSPDGSSIAFASGQSEDSTDDFSLDLVDLKTHVEREITPQRYFAISGICWLPDGKDLLITARKVQQPQFHILKINRNSGEVATLTSGLENLSDLSVDNSGTRLVSSVEVPAFHLKVYSLETNSAPVAVTDALAASYTPDGKIVYSSNMTGNSEIWMIEPNGGHPKQVTNLPTEENAPVASIDGRSIFFYSNAESSAHIWKINVDGTEPKQVTSEIGGVPILSSADGQWLYYHSATDRTLRKVSLVTGKELSVLNKPKFRFSISPDETMVAYAEKNGEERLLTIARLSDGAVVRAFRTKEQGSLIDELAWSPDGSRIVYTASRPDSSQSVWEQDLRQQQPRFVMDLSEEDIRSFALSPDGKSFAIVQGVWQHDAVLITGLKRDS